MDGAENRSGEENNVAGRRQLGDEVREQVSMGDLRQGL